jgi:hypothetical protein
MDRQQLPYLNIEQLNAISLIEEQRRLIEEQRRLIEEQRTLQEVQRTLQKQIQLDRERLLARIEARPDQHHRLQQQLPPPATHYPVQPNRRAQQYQAQDQSNY